MATHKQKLKPTLRFSITFVVAALILSSATVVIAIFYFSARNTLLDFSDQVINQVAVNTRDKVANYLDPAKAGADLTLNLVEGGVIKAGDFNSIERYFFDFLAVYQSVAMLNYGDENGNFIMVKRQPDGSLSTKVITRTKKRGEIEVSTRWEHREPGATFDQRKEVIHDPDDKYDPRGRPWYVGAKGLFESKAAQKVFWTDVYVFHSDQKPGITASVSHVEEGGRFRGVLSIDIALVDLSRFLSKLKIQEHGKAFILDRQQRLIALPDADALIVMKEVEVNGEKVTKPFLRKLDECTLPEIASISDVDAFKQAYENPETFKTTKIKFTLDGENYLGTLMPITGDAGSGWLVGVVVPEDDFLGDIKRTNLIAIAAAVGAMLVALLLALLLSRIVARSLRKLVTESTKIRELEFSSEGDYNSPFQEIHEVLTAFSEMKVGLRSFEKYVPAELVRILLANKIEPKLGGDVRELTIFFSDIRNFTEISERMDVKDLAERLGDYLSAMSECVGEYKGTVDKYIGDAVMAFWGAPLNVEDHAKQACEAALQCVRRTRELEKRIPGMPEMYTRIGIHSASVMVGNFGSAKRLNYTCIGDGVNLAARLEGLSKVYGTHIIISDATWEQVKDTFLARRLDRVAVKGKEEPGFIYELVGRRGETDDVITEETIALYEKGYALYLERKWDEAISAFEQVLARKPDDKASELMIESCKEFNQRPPGNKWRGTRVMTKK